MFVAARGDSYEQEMGPKPRTSGGRTLRKGTKGTLKARQRQDVA
jgi:hypothetical protein